MFLILSSRNLKKYKEKHNNAYVSKEIVAQIVANQKKLETVLKTIWAFTIQTFTAPF